MELKSIAKLCDEDDKSYFVCPSCGKYNEFMEEYKVGDDTMCLRCGKEFKLIE